MKNMVIAILAAAGVIGIAGAVAQQFTAQMGTGALATCPAPVVGSNILCSVTDGLYSSNNGLAYVKVNVQSGGVQTFNSRTGNVLPTPGDYAYSDLRSPPTKIACSTSSQSNTGFTASGCVIN